MYRSTQLCAASPASLPQWATGFSRQVRVHVQNHVPVGSSVALCCKPSDPHVENAIDTHFRFRRISSWIERALRGSLVMMTLRRADGSFRKRDAKRTEDCAGGHVVASFRWKTGRRAAASVGMAHRASRTPRQRPGRAWRDRCAAQ